MAMQTDINIRRATGADAGSLQALFTQLAGESDFVAFGEPVTTPQLQHYLQLQAESASQLCLLLEWCEGRVAELRCDVRDVATSKGERCGEIIGFVIASEGYVSADADALGMVIAIAQGYTGRGYGKDLLQQLQAWAQLQGYLRVALTVQMHNHGAIRFYQALGFSQQGKNAGAYTMQKCLSGRTNILLD